MPTSFEVRNYRGLGEHTVLDPSNIGQYGFDRGPIHDGTVGMMLRMVCSLEDMHAVATTHNTALVSNRLMRPDCCSIMTGGSITSFHNGTDRWLREGHDMESLLRGRGFDNQ